MLTKEHAKCCCTTTVVFWSRCWWQWEQQGKGQDNPNITSHWGWGEQLCKSPYRGSAQLSCTVASASLGSQQHCSACFASGPQLVFVKALWPYSHLISTLHLLIQAQLLFQSFISQSLEGVLCPSDSTRSQRGLGVQTPGQSPATSHVLVFFLHFNGAVTEHLFYKAQQLNVHFHSCKITKGLWASCSL